MSDAVNSQADREADVDRVFAQTQRRSQTGLKCRSLGTGLLQAPRPKRKTELSRGKSHDATIRVLFS